MKTRSVLAALLVTLLFVSLNAQIKSGSFFADKSKSGFTLHQNQGLRTFEIPVSFDNPFESKPRVNVTITLVDAVSQTKMRYSAEGLYASRDGFTIKLSTWGDTQLNALGGYWIAELEPLNLEEEPIEVGKTIQLNNIFFEFNKADLKSESFDELNKVADFLKNNSTVEIEISGHTDNKGSDDYNMTLSQQRAESVVNYLASQGIAENRLTAKGYGESKPVAPNETESGREQNRRVEFTILKK